MSIARIRNISSVAITMFSPSITLFVIFSATSRACMGYKLINDLIDIIDHKLIYVKKN